MMKYIDPKQLDILQLIPQRRPFVMVDKLVSYTDAVCCTEFRVEESNIFCDDGFLSEYGVVENIAQSCAARIGYHCLVRNLSINLGFIGAIKDLQIMGRVAIGQSMSTRIEIESEIFSMTLVRATVECLGNLVATCEMKISLSDIER